MSRKEELSTRRHRSSRRAVGMKRAATFTIALAVLGAVVVKELRKPVRDRTWTGTLGGVPYDLRVPTPERLRAKLWDPDNPRIVTPHVWGVGWAVNVGRVVRLTRRHRP